MAWIGDLVQNPDDLKRRATQLEMLAEMPDRATREDIRGAAAALRNAACDVEKLLKRPLVGCPCRRIEYDDGRSYLVYADECQHHRYLKHEEERLKAAYAAAEKKLADSLRVKFYTAALSRLANFEKSASEITKRALELADSAVSALLR